MRKQPAIKRAYARFYSDSQQMTAYVDWSDGSRTEGRAVPLGHHMTALFDRAKREGLTVDHEKW